MPVMIVLLITGFIIRLYAATTVPQVSDEEVFYYFARQISFDINHLHLPIGGIPGIDITSPPLPLYVAKLGLSLFGDCIWGGRFFFVLIGIFSLFFSYKLVEEVSGRKMALIVLYLLVFSQYHIGISRRIGPEILNFFFSVLSVYCFFKGLKTGLNKWVYLTGIFLGIGYLGKELVILLLPIFLIFLWREQKYRFWLKCKAIYISLALMLFCMSSQIIWSFQNNFANYTSEEDNIFNMGVSLRSIHLYLGEAFAWLADTSQLSEEIRDFPDFEHERIIVIQEWKRLFMFDGDNNLPVEHWVLGAIIFMAVLYYFLERRNKDELTRFSMLMFGFIFIVTTIMGYHPDDFVVDHLWATATLYPGVILSSHMLIELSRKYRFAEFAIPVMIIYFVINSVRFASLPENQFAMSKMDLCEHYIERAEIYRAEGEWDKVRDRCTRVRSLCPTEYNLLCDVFY